MSSTDAAFTGSIPAIYDRHLGPLLFAPYAADLAERAAILRPQRILEVAAGTGILSAEIKHLLPQAKLTVTDLNAAMLRVAMERLGIEAEDVEYRTADAQALPFADDSFDMLLCQFGVMFYPDRIAAHREARRVLRPGGHYLFNVWDRIERNPVSKAVADSVATLFPDDPPRFLERTPFGHHDKARMEAELAEAGFSAIRSWTVEATTKRPAQDAAIGLCTGSPLRAEIESRDPTRLDEAVAAATRAVAALGTIDAVEASMSAIVFAAVA